MIEYADLECPSCARGRMLGSGLDVRRVFRHFPVVSKPPRARALAARRRGRRAAGPLLGVRTTRSTPTRAPRRSRTCGSAASGSASTSTASRRDRRSDAVADRVERDFRERHPGRRDQHADAFVDRVANSGQCPAPSCSISARRRRRRGRASGRCPTKPAKRSRDASDEAGMAVVARPSSRWPLLAARRRAGLSRRAALDHRAGRRRGRTQLHQRSPQRLAASPSARSTAPSSGWVTARLRRRSGDWDVAVFDTRRRSGWSPARRSFGATRARAGLRVRRSAPRRPGLPPLGPCPHRAPSTSTSKRSTRASEARRSSRSSGCPRPPRAEETSSTRLGLDLTEHGGQGLRRAWCCTARGRRDACAGTSFSYTNEVADLAADAGAPAEPRRAGARSAQRARVGAAERPHRQLPPAGRLQERDEDSWWRRTRPGEADHAAVQDARRACRCRASRSPRT